jgi:hypothetical protein
LASGKLAVDILLTDGLTGEVERPLTDGGVPVSVGGSEGSRETFIKVTATILQAAPSHDNLVILRAKVRVFRVNEFVEVGCVLLLEDTGVLDA